MAHAMGYTPVTASSRSQLAGAGASRLRGRVPTGRSVRKAFRNTTPRAMFESFDGDAVNCVKIGMDEVRRCKLTSA